MQDISPDTTIPASLEALWVLIDRVWDNLGLDQHRPDPALLAAFYNHPVWELNGRFTERDPVSLGHRRAITAWVAAHGAATVLDYGGGYGTLARMLARALPTGQIDLYDPFAVMLPEAPPNLCLINRITQSYNVVVCLDVLEHVTEPLATLAHLAAAVEPGGALLVVNHFYPSIKCHLPATFHLRYSFALFARVCGLHYRGRCPGTPATIYERVGPQPVNWTSLRLLEPGSRLLYPVVRAAHRAYRRLRGRDSDAI